MDEVTDATFTADVLSSEVPVIVEFGAPWCRPCKAIEPALTEIADGSAGRVRLVKLDIDGNLGTPSRYGILSIPTVILFVGRRGERDARRPPEQEPLRAGVRAVHRRVTRPWDDLLVGDELAFRSTEPARAARLEALPDDLDPRVVDAPSPSDGHRRPLRPPGGGVGGGRPWRERPRHDGHRVRQVARLQPARARCDRARANRPRALPLPDEGADPGPGAGHRALPPARRAAGDLRRRHRARAASADPEDRRT